MKITLERLNDKFHMKATNEDGQSLEMDGSPLIGGENKGMRPMQVLLSALGGCSTIDVIEFLKKQRQYPEQVQVTIDGERDTNQIPAVFTKIHLHYHLKGDLDDKKVKKACDLSIEKYCSVARMLEKTAEITYDYVIEA